MSKKCLLLIYAFQLFITTSISAQNSRISNYNNIGWYNYLGTLQFSKVVSLHTEYQWRRIHFIQNWQQSVLRMGINVQLSPKLQLRAGYAWIETFAYGDIPINGMGKDFTEHRLYQMFTLSDKISIVDIAHRFIFEQRWIGRYSNIHLQHEDEFLYYNRIRYMLRLQVPLKGKSVAKHTPYAACFDEVMIGFGSNIQSNIFDQNRLSFLLGYKFNNRYRIEAGLLNQAVLFGRQINNRNVMQYNTGLILNTYFNF